MTFLLFSPVLLDEFKLAAQKLDLVQARMVNRKIQAQDPMLAGSLEILIDGLDFKELHRLLSIEY